MLQSMGSQRTGHNLVTEQQKNNNEKQPICAKGVLFSTASPILDTAWLFDKRHSNRWNFPDGSVVKNLSMQET